MYNSTILIDRISQLCTSNNLSVNQMLKNANLSTSVIDNIKRGRIPSVDKLDSIADYFNCSVDYLIGRTNIISNKNEQLTEQERKLLLAYRQNPNMQGAVNRLLGVEQPMRAIKIARSNTSKVTEITGDFSDLFNAPRVLSDDDI